ncbi:DUF302 domain-containing protein [Hyphomicrobium sp.]|uniref:DUF302 domain-containing protein n=1 Tax=Hyphomicrobium sp. TaxID=82 RepID=UPI001D2C18AE|nr:DUF302 domain-containing protein [Hyphomicrobium sp.]MBY0561986.1 DUF302 domain-containing protein [Hyphomicrobium sp.]
MVNGVARHRSHYPAKETADRLAAAASQHGQTLLARIDHAAAAKKVGLELLPTEVLFFGNPSVGTLLMQQSQEIGLELPLRVVVWEDDEGVTWVAHLDLDWLVSQYGIASAVEPTLDKMSAMLKAVLEEATGEQCL